MSSEESRTASGSTITIVPERSTKANRVLVKRERAVDPDVALTKDEAKQVRHGMKQIRKGRFRLLREATSLPQATGPRDGGELPQELARRESRF